MPGKRVLTIEEGNREGQKGVHNGRRWLVLSREVSEPKGSGGKSCTQGSVILLFNASVLVHLLASFEPQQQHTQVNWSQ